MMIIFGEFFIAQPFHHPENYQNNWCDDAEYYCHSFIATYLNEITFECVIGQIWWMTLSALVCNQGTSVYK